jgi:amino acid adenylation domain-containing protein
LGILKAGGAYLPIAADFPQQRIKYMLADSSTEFLVTTSNFTGTLEHLSAGDSQLLMVNLENEKRCDVDKKRLKNEDFKFHKADFAYIIYTSGSTGKSKGVPLGHGNVMNFIEGMKSIIDFSPGKRILALTTISFDIFFLETLLPVTCGMNVVIGNRYQRRDPGLLKRLISINPIDILQVTPTWLQMWLSYDREMHLMKRIKELLVGGEEFPVYLLKKVKKKFNGKIYNMYGPTETTIWSSVKELTSTTGNITIGCPITNTQIYIIDRNYQLQPIGISGELLIGGDGVAKGYLNKPELTAQKFININFETEEDKKDEMGYFNKPQLSSIYCTGDRARWLENGEIQFLGRLDFQVKIRGFRIELGEIETQLLEHNSIKDAVVIVQKHSNNETGNRAVAETFLTAYIVLDRALEKNIQNTEGLDASSLSDYLALYLPAYMIPAYFILVESIPLTPNGKVDRKALTDLQQQRLETSTNYVAPKAGIEQMIANTWKEILQIEKVGIHDNFFKLGGNSMKIVELGRKLNRLFEKEISITMLFRNLTISFLADYYGGEGKNILAVENRSEALARGNRDRQKRLEIRKGRN